jgi:hypothetical protein
LGENGVQKRCVKTISGGTSVDTPVDGNLF